MRIGLLLSRHRPSLSSNQSDIAACADLLTYDFLIDSVPIYSGAILFLIFHILESKLTSHARSWREQLEQSASKFCFQGLHVETDF